MKIKLRTTMAGPAGTHHAGAIINIVDKAQAYDLIERGYAKQIGDETETATKRATEHATAGPQRKAGR